MFSRKANRPISILINIILCCSRLLGSSKTTENNSSSQCTSTTAAYLEMNNMTKWLDGRGCLMIVQRNTSFDGHFCVPDLVPPYSMSAVLNDEPIVAVTIDGCCHLEVVVDTTLSLLRLQYIEEEGCRRRGEINCTLQTREDLESAYGEQPSLHLTDLTWIVLYCIVISRTLIFV